MSKTIVPEATVDETIDYEAAINQMLIEMKQVNEKLERDQEEIDRLKARTRFRLAQVKASLS